MKITIEAEGFQLVLDEDMFESWGLSIPSDVLIYEDGRKELAKMHVSLTALFKEDVRPEWRKIDA